MKTPIQELIEQLKEERDGFMNLPPHSNIQERTENCFGSCIEIAERMLDVEKDTFIAFGDKVSYLNYGDEYDSNLVWNEMFNPE
jgi:hypothetical protein